MGTGDISRAMIENTKETAIDVEVINAQPYPVFARWVKDGPAFSSFVLLSFCQSHLIRKLPA